MRLSGKVAVITGAGAGIGRASAELFAREGASVVIAESNTDTGEAACAAVTDAGGTAMFVHTDVRDAGSVRHMVEQTVHTFGGVDILYNNAGGSTKVDAPVTAAPFEEFWNKMKVDVFGTWLACHYAIPHLIARGGGAVINSTSTYGLVGIPGKHCYAAAKGAIVSLTRAMAVEFAPQRIRVNAIAPARTMTERVIEGTKSGTFASSMESRYLLGVIEPVEIGYAALYLASDESKKVTGHVMTVDSGFTIS